jgi:hypothetical protein
MPFCTQPCCLLSCLLEANGLLGGKIFFHLVCPLCDQVQHFGELKFCCWDSQAFLWEEQITVGDDANSLCCKVKIPLIAEVVVGGSAHHFASARAAHMCHVHDDDNAGNARGLVLQNPTKNGPETNINTLFGALSSGSMEKRESKSLSLQ